jgi:hypothetical protein
MTGPSDRLGKNQNKEIGRSTRRTQPLPEKDDAGRTGTPVAEDQFTEVFVEGDQDAVVTYGTRENDLVVGTRVEFGDPGNIKPCTARGGHCFARCVLVGKETDHSAEPKSSRDRIYSFLFQN